MRGAGAHLQRTYGDRTLLLRVDRRMGSVRFGKVRPDSRTGTTGKTRGWGSGGCSDRARRAPPSRTRAPGSMSGATAPCPGPVGSCAPRAGPRRAADSFRGRNRWADSHRTLYHRTRPQGPGKPIPPANRASAPDRGDARPAVRPVAQPAGPAQVERSSGTLNGTESLPQLSNTI